MQLILEPYIEDAIEKDILSIQNFSRRILENIINFTNLEEEKRLFMEFSSFLSNITNSSVDIDRLHLRLSTAKKLMTQAEIIKSKVKFTYAYSEEVSDLFLDLKIHLKSLLGHFTQLNIE